MIVGTAGHIDHGKTSLVKALTGVDTDRLKEEKARGISIELGYAYLPIKDADSVLGFVDVPGHERFVHHMLAGATGIDYVLLVVAADDGPMPQTREHLQILDLLGLSHGMVALTKCDAVSPERLAEATAEVQALLAGTALEDADILPVSSIEGTGIAELRERLTTAARAMPPSTRPGYFRLAVDRCFTLPGAGTIVTGTAHSGSAAVGDRLLVSPSTLGGGIELRVRSIHAQNRPAERCGAGQRCALNITGAQVDKDRIRRGDWVLEEPVHHPTATLDVSLHLLASEARALRHLASVHFHLGAEHVTGRIALLDGMAVEPGARALARITLARPIGALTGDRFVIRDAAATRTLGGGRVLDPFPPNRGRRTPARLALLGAWESGGAKAALELLLKESSPRSEIALTRFAASANLKPAEAEALFGGLAMHRYAADQGEMALSNASWAEGRKAVLAVLAAEHKRAPGEQGPTRERLKKLLAGTVAADACNAVLAELMGEGAVAASGLALHLPSHSLRMPPADEALWAKVKPLLAEKPLAPPRTDQIGRQLNMPDKALKAAFGRIAKMGHGYMVSPDRFYLREPIVGIAAQIAAHARDTVDANGVPQGVTAAGMRDVLGIGRNVVIELLEFFDRVGYTRRVGDTHRVRNENADMFGPRN